MFSCIKKHKQKKTPLLHPPIPIRMQRLVIFLTLLVTSQATVTEHPKPDDTCVGLGKQDTTQTQCQNKATDLELSFVTMNLDGAPHGCSKITGVLVFNTADTSFTCDDVDVCLALYCTAGSASGDVHLAFPRGGHADFRGTPGKIYNLLSASGLSVGFQVEQSIYHLHGATVNGTFMTKAHVMARTNEGRSYAWTADASRLNNLNYAWDFVKGSCGDAADNATMSGSSAGRRLFVLGPHAHERCDDLSLNLTYATAQLDTPEFGVSIYGQPVYDRIEGPRHRLDIRIHVRTTLLRSAPHGLLGQDYAGDGEKPRNGTVDVYPTSGNFTTTAWAEGAIDGRPEDYEMASPTTTEFRFSRFSEDTSDRADSAKTTNPTKLTNLTKRVLRSLKVPPGSAMAQAV